MQRIARTDLITLSPCRLCVYVCDNIAKDAAFLLAVTLSFVNAQGIPELFVVTEDYVAAGVHGASELRLVKSQHVEVVEWPSSVEGASSEQLCRVRVVPAPQTPASTTDASSNSPSPASEGLVPMSVLRQFMSLRLSNSRTSFSNDCNGQTASDGTPGAVDSPSSATGVVPSTPGAASNAQQRKTSFKYVSRVNTSIFSL